ncbi:hypothetical protein [Flavobacterium foetidum]|uniref:hypothetical protein n=1 Tax=Flavobacterium foetidum TaxID=2026681 RepID=UPI001074FF15|nr:hypothetical protein [Flavobacterium foetidum]KAF2509094.1 hypothetical protein E0W73_18980 [Flavobacterium foetidum]
MRQLKVTSIKDNVMQFVDTDENEFEIDIAQMIIPPHTNVQIGDKLCYCEHHYYNVFGPENTAMKGFVRLTHLRKKNNRL